MIPAKAAVEARRVETTIEHFIHFVICTPGPTQGEVRFISDEAKRFCDKKDPI
jgi:hypothetical protein